MMTYVIGTGCVDGIDKSCVQQCPVDCIYEGDRARPNRWSPTLPQR